MWGVLPARCPVCGAPAAQDYLYCFRCGTAIIAPAAFPAEVPRRAVDRTRAGLLWTVVALALLWIPGVTALGALCLSVGSTLMYLDRRRFPGVHRRSMGAAYVVLWVAALVYGLVFLQLLSEAWTAWENFRPMAVLEGAVYSFVLVSTVPALLVVAALVLQVRSILPGRLRAHAVWAGIVLAALVGIATYIAYVDLALALSGEPVRMASVLGVLNRISVARLVEAPGFAWLAYLYWRARENIVPATAPRREGVAVPE